jgi:AcrR family transcriptional regulator
MVFIKLSIAGKNLMDEKNKSTDSTRQKLLTAACEVFAENGFKNTTVRDICNRAEVNVAAINYHFGNKEKLYEAVWEYANSLAVKKRLEIFDLEGISDPEKRIRIFIKTLLDNILNQERPEWDFRIVAHEMMEPTGAFNTIIEKMIRPSFLFLRDIVQEMLGEDAPKEQVEKCTLSIVGQCLYYRFANPVVRRLLPEQTFDEKGLDELADHITEFSLSAIKQLRRGIEDGREG